MFAKGARETFAVQLLRVTTGERIRQLGPPRVGKARVLWFSPDSRTVAVLETTDRLSLWDVGSGKQLRAPALKPVTFDDGLQRLPPLKETLTSHEQQYGTPEDLWRVGRFVIVAVAGRLVVLSSHQSAALLSDGGPGRHLPSCRPRSLLGVGPRVGLLA